MSEKQLKILEENIIDINRIELSIGNSKFYTDLDFFKGEAKSQLLDQEGNLNSEIIINSTFTTSDDKEASFEVPFTIKIKIKHKQ